MTKEENNLRLFISPKFVVCTDRVTKEMNRFNRVCVRDDTMKKC